MGYIPQESLENLKKYAYKGVDKSVVSKYVLNPFWTWFVTLWPKSVAPNTITFSGLCIVIANFMTMLYYDPTYLTIKGGVETPSWVYFSYGIGLFMYQAFDAIDGKQARRTNMAGPLGEMFDHGCDAMNTTLEAIITCHALNLGRSWWTVASQVATLANFYLTTWEEYHTGQLFLGVFSGPVEGILLVVGIYFITGFCGPEFWDTPVLALLRLDELAIFEKVPSIAINEAFMVFAAFGLAFNIFSSYMNVHYAKPSETSANIQARRQAGPNPLLLLLPFPVAAAIQVAWLYPSHIVQSALFVPFMGAWGLQFAHQVGRMILAHVTSTPFPVWDWIWVLSIVGAIDANLAEPIIQTSPRNTAFFVYGTLAVSFVVYFRFCTLVINDITEYMGIACFTVRKKGQDGVWRDAMDEKKV